MRLTLLLANFLQGSRRRGRRMRGERALLLAALVADRTGGPGSALRAALLGTPARPNAADAPMIIDCTHALPCDEVADDWTGAWPRDAS